MTKIQLYQQNEIKYDILEHEIVEFKGAKNNFSDLSEYFSALCNEVNLKNNQ